MRRKFTPERMVTEQELTGLEPQPGGKLTLAVLAEDAWTAAWAGEVCQRVQELAGSGLTSCKLTQLADLAQPAVFTEAVSDAAAADMIVVCVRATEQLSEVLAQWLDAWVLRRARRPGALVALISSPETAGPAREHTREYLRGLARRCRLDFLADQRAPSGHEVSPPAAPPADSSSTQPSPHSPDRDALTLYPRHWGINE